MFKRHTILLFFIVLMIVSGCSSSHQIFKVKSCDQLGSSAIGNDSLYLISVIDINCPISQYAVKVLNDLEDQYADERIVFVGVIPGKYYSAREIRDFKTEYSIDYPIYLDAKFEAVQCLKATITPECYIMDGEWNIYYSGALDDKYKALGKSSIRPNVNYVDEALKAVLSTQPVKTRHVSAVGCIIEQPF